jgi:WD40 repeat protein
MNVRSAVAVAASLLLAPPAAAQEARVLFDSSRDANNTDSRHCQFIDALAFTPDGKKVLMASTSRNLLAHTIAGQTLESGDEFAEKSFVALVVSPDGRGAASLHEDGSVAVWDVASLKTRHRVKWPDGRITALAYSPDSKTLLLAGVLGPKGDPPAAKSVLKVWDAVRAKEKSTRELGDNPITAVAVAPDGKALVAGLLGAGKDAEGVIQPLGPGDESDPPKLPFKDRHAGAVTALAFDPSGKFLLSGGADRTVRLFDPVAQKELAVLAGHARPVTLLGFLPDGTPFSGSQGDGTLRVWDVAGERERAIVRRDGFGTAVAVSADRKLAASGGPKGLIVWDLSPLFAKTPEKPAK